MEINPSFVIRVRENTRGSAGAATVAWSVVLAACFFAVRAREAQGFFELVAVVGTFLYAAYLGWRRRMGLIFIAPLVSWMFAWIPLIVAEMIRDGIVRGFFVGLFLVTIGWIAIGGAEFLVLFAIATPFRFVVSIVHPGPKVTIESPFRFK